MISTNLGVFYNAILSASFLFLASASASASLENIPKDCKNAIEELTPLNVLPHDCDATCRLHICDRLVLEEKTRKFRCCDGKTIDLSKLQNGEFDCKFGEDVFPHDSWKREAEDDLCVEFRRLLVILTIIVAVVFFLFVCVCAACCWWCCRRTDNPRSGRRGETEEEVGGEAVADDNYDYDYDDFFDDRIVQTRSVELLVDANAAWRRSSSDLISVADRLDTDAISTSTPTPNWASLPNDDSPNCHSPSPIPPPPAELLTPPVNSALVIPNHIWMTSASRPETPSSLASLTPTAPQNPDYEMWNLVPPPYNHGAKRSSGPASLYGANRLEATAPSLQTLNATSLAKNFRLEERN